MIKKELKVSIAGLLENEKFIMSPTARNEISTTERVCTSSVGKDIDAEIMF